MKKLSFDAPTQGYRSPSVTATVAKKTASAQAADRIERGGSSSGRRVGKPAYQAHEQVKKSGSAFGAILSAFGGRRLRQVGAGAALFMGAVSIPGVAMADYVRIDQDAPQIVESAQVPHITPSLEAVETPFDPDHLQDYKLFEMFWSSNIPGTSQGGVWALSPEGVGHLLEYARTHDLDGDRRSSPSDRAGPIDVTEGHRALVEHLLEDPYYTAFISQDAVPLLRAAFDLPEAVVAEQPQHAPVDRGEVRVCSPEQWWGTNFDNWAIRDMPRALKAEYDLGTRAGRYERAASLDDKKYEMTCLLHQFGASLNAHDDLSLPEADQVKHAIQSELLDTFFALPIFATGSSDAAALHAYFASDFNGSGMGLAQAIAKGFDANDFPTAFPNASGRSSPVSLSMSVGNLLPAMQVLDQIRVADGRDPAAVALKNLPSIGYMVGEPSGHDKLTFDERSPPLDRLNYGKLIDPRIADLPPQRGFTFPIDAITVTGMAVIADSSTRMEIQRASDSARLDVEVNFQNDADGNPVSWTLTFTDARGEVVQPQDVVGLLKKNGRTLGDGKANQSLETGYWGHCDDNTGANMIFGRFADLPERFVGQVDGNDNVFIRVRDGLFGVPTAQAPSLVYMDLPGIGNTENPIDGGYRFGYDASEIKWSRDTMDYRNFGAIEGFTPSPFTQTNHRFVTGDVLRIHNTADEPLFGVLRLETNGRTQSVDAREVRLVIDLGEQVRVVYERNGSMLSLVGKSLTDLSSLDWTDAQVGADPSAKTPGSEHTVQDAAPDETLTSLFAKLTLGERGVTPSQLLRANPEILARTAQTVAPGESVTLPAITRTVTSNGQTLEELVKEATPPGARERAVLQANRNLIAVSSEPVPPGTTVQIGIPEFRIGVQGDTAQTLAQLFVSADLASLGYTPEQLAAANPDVQARVAGWVRNGDEIAIPERAVAFTEAKPFDGDFLMHRTDGVDITVRASEVEYIQGETPHDVRFTHYLQFVQRSEGVYGNEGSLTRSISNGRKWINDVQMYQTRGADRPEWSGSDPLVGIEGPLVRRPGDKLVFAAGIARQPSYESTTFSGWYQVDEASGRILNEGFTRGEPDFVWGIHAAKLNWHAPSTYIGDAMRSEYRLGIVVNGIADLRNQTEEGQRIAEALDLPSNWASYIVSADDVQAHLAANRE